MKGKGYQKPCKGGESNTTEGNAYKKKKPVIKSENRLKYFLNTNVDAYEIN